MNGIHDMGGMHGMGPIAYEKNPPVFHEPWEGRAWALVRTMGPWGRGRWKGSFRYELERIPPDEYLRMPYTSDGSPSWSTGCSAASLSVSRSLKRGSPIPARRSRRCFHPRPTRVRQPALRE